MSIWRALTPGYDPTSSGSAPTNSQLLQMWTQGIPAAIGSGSGGGFIVWAATAPDVVTYPDLIRCIWGKVSGTTPTGYFYYYDGSAWQPWELEPGTIDGDVFAVGSIPVDRLEAGANATICYTNSSGDVVWAALTTVIPANTLTGSQLVNAPGADYIWYSGPGGVWAAATFASKLAAGTVFITQLENSDSGGLDNQVLHVTESGSGAGVSLSYIETLMRANQTPTNKLNLSAFAGNRIRVNAAGTDFENATADIATFVDTGASGTAPLSLLANTLTTVRLAAEASLPSWASVSSNEITLTAGTYIIEATVPVYVAGGGFGGYLAWVEGGTTRKTANAYIPIDGDQDRIPLFYKTTLSATTVCKLQIYMTGVCDVGKANSIASIPEVYTQVKITRL